MRILVTGASGFIGRHVLDVLQATGHEITATSRSSPVAVPGVRFVAWDLNEDRRDYSDLFGRPDRVIHLAWEGLPHYTELFHVEKNLPANYRFLQRMIETGTRDITVLGTCFEYGRREGRLSEEMAVAPCTAYGTAKHVLRLLLDELRCLVPFDFKWIRPFYLYGKGQRSRSILGQLEAALERGDRIFNMSGGQQIRDYLDVAEAARLMVDIALQNRVQGVINLCSGRPISVRKLVEDHLRRLGKTIELNLGHYPYTDYEPHAFWGNTEKLREVRDER